MKQNIILDTSFIIAQNYLHGRIIKDLLTLQKRKVIQVYLTDIVLNETLSNFKKSVEVEIPKYKTEKKKLFKNIRFVKNLTSYANIETSLPDFSQEKLIAEFNAKFKSWIEKNSIIIIPSENITIKSAFSKYFDCTPPFSLSKKHEFPDAFSIEASEIYFKEKNENAILFTMDNDLLNCQANSITITSDYKKFIDDLNRDIGNLGIINYLENSLEENKPILVSEIDKNIEELFTDWALSGDFMTNREVHTIWDVKITNRILSKPEILFLEEGNAELACSYSFLLESFMEYDDYAKAVYDKEEKELIGISKESFRFSRQFKLPITIKATFDQENNICQFLIEDINYGFPIYNDD